MITPFFKLRQDDAFLFVEIRAPNANIRDTEVEFFDRSLYFSSVPYFLRLALTGDVDGGTVDAKTDYNVDTGMFLMHCSKCPTFRHIYDPNAETQQGRTFSTTRHAQRTSKASKTKRPKSSGRARGWRSE
jgi:hypothetical protein